MTAVLDQAGLPNRVLERVDDTLRRTYGVARNLPPLPLADFTGDGTTSLDDLNGTGVYDGFLPAFFAN